MFFVYSMRFSGGKPAVGFPSFDKEISAGICHCGHIFQFQTKGSDTSYEDITCPVCGAKYGNVFDRFFDSNTVIPEGEAGKEVMWQTIMHRIEENYFCGREKCLHRVEPVGDDVYIVRKENLYNRVYKDCVRGGDSCEVTVQMRPVVKFLRVVKNGQEIKITKSSVASALSYTSAHWRDIPSELRKELEYGAQVIGSYSLSKILMEMNRYPSINSSYNNEDFLCRPLFLRGAYEHHFLKSGERSPKKALGLDSKLLKHCIDKNVDIFLVQRYMRNTETKPELASLCAQMTIDVCGLNFNPELANLLSTLTTAERKRLYQYLVYDTEVYQGIEDHREAWDYLKDYRRMCKEMDIAPDLCPRSLKLQHDIATRNYHVCLDERRRKRFHEVVKSEDYQRLQWTSGNWVVLIPSTPDDIIEEGRKQCHCVGSYVNMVLDGVYRICFLRRADNPDKPVLTLTVSKDDGLLYYKGRGNREVTAEERTVLEAWTKAKNLTIY